MSRAAYEKPTPAGLSIKSKLAFLHQVRLDSSSLSEKLEVITGPMKVKATIMDVAPGPP